MRAALALLAVAGCAAVGPQVGSLPSPLLCYVNYAGSVSDREMTEPELRRRGFSCTDRDIELGRLDFEMAQRRAAAPSYTPPPMYIIPPRRGGLNCTTSENGRETTCW